MADQMNYAGLRLLWGKSLLTRTLKVTACGFNANPGLLSPNLSI
jgi:hypothetical protein